MNEFIRMAIRAFNEKRNRIEKRIIKTCNILPADLYRIVLGYSIISDLWVAPGYFNNKVLTNNVATGRNIKIIPWQEDGSPDIAMSIKLKRSINDLVTDFADTELIVFSPIFELYKWILGGPWDVNVFIDWPPGMADDERSRVIDAFIHFVDDQIIWSQ